MFTGIIEGLGNVKRLTAKGADAVIEIEAAIDLKDVSIGDSIAVNGACLTVISKKEKFFPQMFPQKLSLKQLLAVCMRETKLIWKNQYVSADLLVATLF